MQMRSRSMPRGGTDASAARGVPGFASRFLDAGSNIFLWATGHWDVSKE